MSFLQKQNINADKINNKNNNDEQSPVYKDSLVNINKGGIYKGMTRSIQPQHEFFQQGKIMGKMNDVSAPSELIGDLKLENFLGNKASLAPHYDDFGKKNKNDNYVNSNVSFGNIGGPASDMNPSKSHPLIMGPSMTLFNPSDNQSLSKSSQSPSKLQQPNPINLEAEIWDGPESYESGFYRSEEKPKEIKEKIVKKLKELSESECECLDYNENGYEIDGRMFDKYNGDMSEFRVTIWKNDNNNNKYQSIVHVRKQGGDGFLYSELQDKIINNLNNLKPKNEKENENENEEEESNMLNNNPFSFEFDLDMDIEENDLKSPLSSSNIESLNFNSNSNLNSNSNSNSDFNMLNKLDYNFELSLPQEEEEESNENENKNEPIDKEQYIKEIINEVCNEENYMENIQNSTCLLLKLNDDDMKILFTCKENIIDQLLISIEKQFDVQQIRNILIVCQRLLELKKDQDQNQNQNQNQNYNKQQNVKYSTIIKSILSQWKNGATRTIGTRTIKFGQSQQIVKCCNKCISLLQ